jgi:hypothetical protein
LANPAKWVTKGVNTQAVWGECQGSGSKPYQTQIDLANIAFKCSCPSRKFPCKHGVALGLLYVRQPALFTDTEAPAWVTEWISKRTEKEEKKVEKKEKEVDEVAQAKRQQAREKKVADGIEEVLLWIKDIIRNGIISMPDKGYAFWEGMAKRMVDAQAPGLAGMVRGLGATNFYTEGWQTPFMDNLLNLYLVAQSYQRKESLDPLVLQEVRSWVGFSQNQDQLKEQPGMTDTWLVVGKQVTEEENLVIERMWLYGMKHRHYALVLQFLFRGQGATLLLSPGMYIEAELVYYPSTAPLRALVKQHKTAVPQQPEALYGSWQDVAYTETEVCARFPVRSERAYAVEQIVPVLDGGRWWLKDSQHNLVAIKQGFEGIWKLLAMSGGSPLDMVVVGREGVFEPLGIWQNNLYKAI